MLTKEQNELLTRTSRGTPMGDFMRRYWIPVLLSEELPAPDCPPVQIRILGEDLVAFRDSQGRIGLLEEHCSHRGTSLFYGRNENCGLTCIYHGWTYDVEGHVLDTPAEPAGSTFKDRLQHPAYPTHEAAGTIFAYMGPKEKQPLFPNYVWANLPAGHTMVTKSWQDCNYLQGVEGECDSTHLTFLHRFFNNHDPRRPLLQHPVREYTTEETDFGMRLVAVREPEPGESYVRVSSIVLPTYCWIPGATKSVHTYIPIDDEHSWRFNLNFQKDAPFDDAIRNRMQSEPWFGPDYRKIRNKDNHYLIDREKQKTENFTGLGTNFVIHDSMATESMGSLFDRSKEHLGLSDKAVIAERRYLLDVLKAFQEGAEPPNLVYDEGDNVFTHVDTFAETMAGSDWRAAFPHLTRTRHEARTAVGAGR
jgi:phenylpropionate dioxygenase-like ring-hydroxylating dioxygenase large terminal subunit